MKKSVFAILLGLPVLVTSLSVVQVTHALSCTSLSVTVPSTVQSECNGDAFAGTKSWTYNLKAQLTVSGSGTTILGVGTLSGSTSSWVTNVTIVPTTYTAAASGTYVFECSGDYNCSYAAGQHGTQTFTTDLGCTPVNKNVVILR